MSQRLAILAGLVLAGMSSACVAPAAVSSAAAVPSIQPSGAAPVVVPMASPTVTPCALAPVPPTVALSGHVYDQRGAALTDEVAIHIESLDASVPFSVDVVSARGAFSLAHAPAHLAVRVSASLPCGGATSRTVQLDPAPGSVEDSCHAVVGSLELNFGGPVTPSDKDAPGYALPDCSTPCPPDLAVVRIQIFGHIYDEFGRPVPGATVTIDSTDRSVPFHGSATTLVSGSGLGAYRMPWAISEAVPIDIHVVSSCGTVTDRHLDATARDFGKKFPDYFPPLAPCSPGGSPEEIDLGIMGVTRGAFALPACGP